ncbi:alpha/beta fold hydrolase, partial [Vibrio parahaemolyticus]
KLVCVHGLTRNARDFDWLAEALADRLCVICPDLPGRGRSEWLPEASLYQPASYVVALAHVLARIGEQVAWVGTSLGGICGMLLAAAPGTP